MTTMPRKDIIRSCLPILPSTTVAALLDEYPQLEDVLIGVAPAFQKLKNPILRKTVGRVASLEQAAAVGHMSARELVNRLRVAVGQENLPPEEASGDTRCYFPPRPAWFDSSRIAVIIEEKNCHPDKMPVTAILQRMVCMQPGEILELVTTFLPAPGIDLLRKKNLLVWSIEEKPELIRTYVCKPAHTRFTETR